MAQDPEKKTSAAVPAGGPELRLLDRRAFVGFPSLEVGPGVTIADFALLIPEVTFPFNLAGGPSRYQRKTLQFGFLELVIDAEVITREVQRVAAKVAELDELKLHFRPSYLEAQARLRDAQRTGVTFKVAFDGDGERLAVYLYDVRLYGFSATPAAQLPTAVARAVEALELLPSVELRGATGFSTRVLPQLCQLAAVSRGYKVPNLDSARLSAAEVSAKGLRLRFSSGGLPPPAIPDEALLLTLEGARAFAGAEALLSEGKLAEAREAYLKLGDVHDAHPFAAERLLSLLAADPSAHELAMDVAESLLRRRSTSATALWADAVVRERRGESARAAERYLALCALARAAHDEGSAFFSAESAARAAREHAPQMAVRALHELLGIRPDHLPSLKALARASDLAKDRAGAIRAYRRISALARDPAEAADAHVHLARLCAETEDDVPGARLHCEAALKLSPDHPEALLRLGELCHRAGEHLRALKALDRLREVAQARHEIGLVGQASLLAGRVWEDGLGQLENALLRYREAVSLLPQDPQPHYLAAHAAEGLGKLQEALAGYQQCIELAGPAPAEDVIRKAAHQAHHALARLARTRLADPSQAREHLEAALALDPRDMVALEELLPYFRATGRSAELADACQKAAAATEEPTRRAAFWAEAGELYRGRLGDADKADRLLNAALEADPTNRAALEGMLALAESRRDGGQLCRCLKALAELSGEPKERARLLRRLAVAARDLAFDLDGATWALTEVLKLEPEDLSALGELCGLHRKRADMNGLVGALEQRARIAEAQGDRRLASAALREMSQVLELRLGRVGEALAAMEKAARLAPDHGVLLDLADLALRCERPEHARKALEELLSQLPKHAAPERVAEIRARLGRACELVGDREGAKAQYAQAFPLRLLDDTLAGRLESLYVDSGQVREAAELWAVRAQALLNAGRPDAAAALYLRAGRSLLDLGDRPGALVRLEAALESAPQGPEAAEVLELMAELELERGGKLEAAKLLSRRAGMMPPGRDAARILFRCATLSAGTGREQEYLTGAIDQDPLYPAPRVRRAELLATAEPERALADLELVLDATGTDPDAPSSSERVVLHRAAARSAARAHRVDVARRHLSAYSAVRGDDVEALRELAELHRLAGAQQELCDLLATLWPRLAVAEQGASLREYAQLCLTLDRTVPAIGALRSLLSRDPANGWAARAMLGLLPAEAPEPERLGLLAILIDQASGEERSELISRRAGLHLAAGRHGEARADLLSAAELTSTPRELLRRAALAARGVGDELGELSTLRQILTRDPGLVEELRARLLELSQLRFEAGDFTAALEGFTASVTGATSAEVRSEAQLGIARAALALGDSHAAAAAFRQVAAEGPKPRRLEGALALARLSSQAGDLDAAVDAYQSALQLRPGLAEAEEGLEKCLTAQEDWEGLAELYASQASAAPAARAADLLEQLAALYLDKLEQPGPAEAALRRVVGLDKARASAHASLAALLFERGEVVEATRWLEEAADRNPPEAAAELLRGGADACLDAGELDLALKLSRKAVALAPATGTDLLVLGRLLYARGALAEALPHFRALAREVDLTDDPETAEEVLFALADLLERTGDPTAAETVLRRILEARPTQDAAIDRLSELVCRRDPRAGLTLAIEAHGRKVPSARTAHRLVELAERAHGELVDLELSLGALRRAAEMSDDPLAVHRRIADLLREAGRTGELGVALERVAQLSIAGQDPYAAIEAYEEMARLAEEGGRVDAALATLERARIIWEDQGSHSSAAVVERRRAEILRDAKLDLAAAHQAFERAFSLAPELETAQLALTLCRRREDPTAEATWLRRAVELTAEATARGGLFLELARLFEGPLASAQEAETAARQALDANPALAPALELLVRLLERSGRRVELAQLFEERAGLSRVPSEKAALFRKAAGLYRDHAGQPALAVPALLAARSATPEDTELTRELVDALREAGRLDEAAEYDALLLEGDPLDPVVFARHRAYLKDARDHQGLAALLLRRAERQEPREAAESYLEAGAALRAAGAKEQSQLCEDRAFAADPANDAAFQSVRARAQQDVRALGQVLAARAGVLPREESVQLLRERAQLLLEAREELLAAEAFDELLAVTGEDADALSARAELAAASGGALAAQPYDRRLMAVPQEALPVALKVRSRLRLGHAALSKGALHDAADAFEEVVLLDGEGDRGREALSLLSEVHAKTSNREGLFKTSLLLARTAGAEDADALLRRASSLFEDPTEAIDALLPLARRHPGESTVVDRAVAGLRALARHQELVELCEKGAEASGGGRAAQLLLQAAQVATEALEDPERAHALHQRAATLDPDNQEVLQAMVVAQRQRGDRAGLLTALERLIASGVEEDERSALRLELAQVSGELGDAARARAALEAVFAAGPSGGGYRPAVEGLARLLSQADEPAALARVLTARAELSGGKEKAEFLRVAGEAFLQAGEPALAAVRLRESVELVPSLEGVTLLAKLYQSLGEHDRCAAALVQASELGHPDARGAFLAEAAEAREAAGQNAEAAELLERAAAAAPHLLPAAVLAEKLLRLEQVSRALEVGFGPALEAGDLSAALTLADAAGDSARAEQALWALAERGPEGDPAALDSALARLEQSVQGEARLRLAGLCEAARPGLSAQLYVQLAHHPSGAQREAAVDRLVSLEGLSRTATLLLAGAVAHPELGDGLVRRARDLTGEPRAQALEALAGALTARRPALLRELFELHLSEERLPQAATALGQLIEAEHSSPARAALRIQLAQLHQQQGEETRAREAYELALADDPQALVPVRHLVSLYLAASDEERFVAMADRLVQLAGESAIEAMRVPLADAYQRRGRRADAYRLLGSLEETPERLERRATLAAQLGLAGDALQLRERLATTPQQLEQVLFGYVEAGLIPFAARLAERLEAQSLAMETRRTVAERLSPTPEGAQVAARLWPALLRASPVDADGWTLFAEALLLCGQDAAAQQADGFGAALTHSQAASPSVKLEPVARELGEAYGASRPSRLVPVTGLTMPRLHGSLSATLSALGASDVLVSLDPSGGVEGYLVSPTELVLGAGALACFGASELAYLCALALELGNRGQALTGPGEVEGWVEAATRAYEAVPGALAASRVLGHLDPSVRGADPLKLQLGPVLRRSAAFRAVAAKALDLV